MGFFFALCFIGLYVVGDSYDSPVMHAAAYLCLSITAVWSLTQAYWLFYLNRTFHHEFEETSTLTKVNFLIEVALCLAAIFFGYTSRLYLLEIFNTYVRGL